ncbi:hypothetical protein KI387_007070, partial [Taxus chinensis]
KRVSNVAHNITNRECTPVFDSSSPVYITIGDGGNVEGLAAKVLLWLSESLFALISSLKSDMVCMRIDCRFTEPQPEYSTYREASFGHAVLELKNRTHAYYHWHRNQDGEAVVSDSQWFYN